MNMLGLLCLDVLDNFPSRTSMRYPIDPALHLIAWEVWLHWTTLIYYLEFPKGLGTAVSAHCNPQEKSAI